MEEHLVDVMEECNNKRVLLMSTSSSFSLTYVYWQHYSGFSGTWNVNPLEAQTNQFLNQTGYKLSK